MSNKKLKHENLKQLKSKDKEHYRNQILKEQDGKCSICNQKITEETGISLDHQHKLKSETIGEDGAGLIRGILCRSCNVWEGRIWNNTQRYKQSKSVQERIDLLESLIKYYKSGTYNLIHPNEKPKQPEVSKRNFNKLNKLYNGKKKFPVFPKSGKLTKQLEKLFKDYNISPFN